MNVLDVTAVLWFFVPAYAADVSPIFARMLFPRLDAPIDGGRTLGGRPLLGSHKTWRGVAACVIAGIAAYEIQRAIHGAGFLRYLAVIDYEATPVLPGLLIGLGAGVGDAVKSLLKRRLAIAPGATWLPFDQIDFFLGALAFASVVYVPPLDALLVVLPVVFVCDVAATTLFWWLGLKERWI